MFDTKSMMLDWEETSKKMHQQISDDMVKDKTLQEYMMEKYTTLPVGDRIRHEQIETAALNMYRDENGVVRHMENNAVADENDIEKLEYNIQKQMLANNILMDEEVVKWDGSSFVLKPYREWKRIHEDRGKTVLKPTPFSKEGHERMIDKTTDVNTEIY